MDIEKVKEFIKLLEESELKKLTIKEKDSELVLEKEDAFPKASAHPIPMQVAQAPQVSEPKEQVVEEGSFITSPMVGTFYQKPAPDQQPFVQKGDRVEEDTVVCIVEAMKVMNEVKAGISGTVAEVLSSDGSPVEYGTKLFRIV